MNFITETPAQTRRIGEILAKEVLKNKFNTKRSSKKAQVLGLEGDLGGGKTTFLQGFARGLRIKKKILSPTFIIMRKFQIPDSKLQKSKFKNFYHIDCYRINKPKEILDLGLREIISNPQNIVAVEWSDRIGKILPRNRLILKLSFINKTKRKIVVK